ncbi:MAG: hypothetical protein HFG40_01915 [Bacilli bacterium]|nr:hypothetical protein [Bacilli bacterium]
MKVKNIKYYTALIFLALNVSLTGCKAGFNKTTDIEIEKSTEDIEKEMAAQKLGSQLSQTGREVVTTALYEIGRVQGIKEGLGDLVELESIQIYQNKNKENYQLNLTTKNGSVYNSVVENDLESMKNYMEYMKYSNWDTIGIASCEDISILDAIPNKERITTIIIGNSTVEDLSNLANFPNIEKVFIHNCPNIENIDVLSTLTNLKRISLIGTKVSDLKAISELKELTTLDLRCNELTEEGIEPLNDLPNLKKVDLYYNRIYDPEALNHLEEKGLQSDNEKQIVVATSTSNLLITTEENYKKTAFCRLLISKIKTKDKYLVSLENENGLVETFGLLDNVETGRFLSHQYDEVTLRYCEDCDILENIEQPEKVKSIYIELCDFEQLEHLEKYKNVETIFITGNPSLSNIENLSGMEKLKNIQIENTNVSDITSFSDIPTLENISIIINPIEDISALLELPNLKMVDLRFNSIQDEKSIEALGEVVHEMKDAIKSQSEIDSKQKSLTD